MVLCPSITIKVLTQVNAPHRFVVKVILPAPRREWFLLLQVFRAYSQTFKDQLIICTYCGPIALSSRL